MEQAPNKEPLGSGSLHRHRKQRAIHKDLQWALDGEAVHHGRSLVVLLADCVEFASGWINRLKLGLAACDGSILKNPATQTPAPHEKRIGSGGDGFIHPVAGLALLDSFEKHAPDTELASDQAVQINSRDEDISPQSGTIE